MIAVKGMEMPSCCAKCKFCEYNVVIGYYCVANNGGNFTITRDEMKEKRLDDCPLTEIITCKDCEHNAKGCFKGYCKMHECTVNDDYSCFLAERKNTDASID